MEVRVLLANINIWEWELRNSKYVIFCGERMIYNEHKSYDIFKRRFLGAFWIRTLLIFFLIKNW